MQPSRVWFPTVMWPAIVAFASATLVTSSAEALLLWTSKVFGGVNSVDHIQPALSVPQFDPSIGILGGVGMFVTSAGYTTTDLFENQTDSTIYIDTGSLKSSLTVFGPGHVRIDRIDINDVLSVPRISPVSPNSRFRGDLGAPNANSYTGQTDPFYLEEWIGTGTVAIGAYMDVTYSGSLGGLINISNPSHIGGASGSYEYTAQIVYGYTKADYNKNGIVDSGDYVMARKGLGPTNTQADYDKWRANFGDSAAISADMVPNSAVPEPSTLLLLAISAISLLGRRKARSCTYS